MRLENQCYWKCLYIQPKHLSYPWESIDETRVTTRNLASLYSIQKLFLFQRNQNKISRSLTDLFKQAGQACDQIFELPLKQAQALLIQHVEEMRDDRKLAPNNMRQRVSSLIKT